MWDVESGDCLQVPRHSSYTLLARLHRPTNRPATVQLLSKLHASHPRGVFCLVWTLHPRLPPQLLPPPPRASACFALRGPHSSLPLQLPPRRPAHQVLEGHTDEIFSAAFNYEGPCVPSALWGTSGAPLLRPEPDLLLATQLRRRVAAATPVARAPPLIPPSRPLPSCYAGDTIITGSKDNTCRIWKC